MNSELSHLSLVLGISASPFFSVTCPSVGTDFLSLFAPEKEPFPGFYALCSTHLYIHTDYTQIDIKVWSKIEFNIS